MKLKHLSFFLLLLFLFSCKKKEKAIIENTYHSPIAKNLDEYFTALTKLKKFNGVVLVHQDGQEIFKKAFNISNESK